ncbi:MAG: RagB/SusD family nutrient uptake outer membrane protein [Porphyromonadaceae bacterium]|nr:RagB/SusD family nutrient uptake outer membrane protein [Porphyromonadaceae bacterium]
MKKINIIVAFFATILLTAGCNDFLSPEAPSSFYPEYVYSNVNDAKKGLLGAYALFAEDPYTSRMSIVWMQNTDVEAFNPGNDYLAENNRRTVWNLQPSKNNGFNDIYNAWQNNYLAIDRANQTIEGIKASPVKDNPEMKMMLAEAHVLRAYRYFLLTNFWGDVPYFREAAKYGMELDAPKTDKNIIYSGMIQDLVDYEGDMFYADEFSDGIERMNRDFALGMIARLSLFRAGYGMTKDGTMKRAEEYLDVTNPELTVTYTNLAGESKTASTSRDYYELAKNYAQKLINERPRGLGDFATIFRDQCELTKNPEVLYEVAFGSGASNSRGDVGWCVGVGVYGGSKGTTTIQTGLTPVYYYSFDPKDTRRAATCTQVAYQNDNLRSVEGITDIKVAKWNRLWTNQSAGSSKSTGVNWPIMRYTDVLLMLAEAENEINGGPTVLAKDMLKTVRSRAFKAEDHGTSVNGYVDGINSKEAFFEAIVNERAWEFGGEGLRKFDLVRWNIYGKKIAETKRELDYMGQAANELNLDNPEVAKYSNIANYLYFQRVAGVVTLLNTDFRPEEVPAIIINDRDPDTGEYNNTGDDEYIRRDWARSLYRLKDAEGNDITPVSADYTQRAYYGYTDETGNSAVPYLLPISVSTISASSVLNNDGYGLGVN